MSDWANTAFSTTRHSPPKIHKVIPKARNTARHMLFTLRMSLLGPAGPMRIAEANRHRRPFVDPRHPWLSTFVLGRYRLSAEHSGPFGFCDCAACPPYCPANVSIQEKQRLRNDQ